MNTHPVMIRPYHQAVISRIIAQFCDEPEFPALIIGGSVAKGIAHDTSDVDIMLVATEEEFQRRAAAQALWYYDKAICDYPGGYVDGKIVTLNFLNEVRDHGSEPARWAFSGAFIGYSRIPQLTDIITAIPMYPEAERAEKLQAFFAQVWLWGGYFMQEAVRRDDPYLTTQAAASLVLFAGRLILAWNRMLFPNQKRLLETVALAPEQPTGFGDLLCVVLRHPTVEHAETLRKSIRAFQDWGITPEQAVTRYTMDSEWRWRLGRADLADW